MRRLQGLLALVHDTIDAVTTLVQETQNQSAERAVRGVSALTPAGPAAEFVNAVRGGVATGVFDSIRTVNRAVEQTSGHAVQLIDTTLEALGVERAGLQLPSGVSAKLSPALDAMEAGLNAAFGDFLAARHNGLAIELGLYCEGKRLELTQAALRARLTHATGQVAVFVHGLGCTESAFRMYAREHYGDDKASYPALLQQELGLTPLLVRYNTGRHISENGRDLANLLTELCRVYPVPIERLVLIGHSMGGLVSRSAAHYGQIHAAPFVDRLSHIVCIGSPHHGAPLEKVTNLMAAVLGFIPAAGTEVPAKLLNARSSGVKDLRYGYIVDEDWTGKDPDGLLADDRKDVPMLDHVVYAFIAGSFARDAHSPWGQLLGDLLVRVPSGRGEHPERARHIPFQVGEVLYGLHHLALINHPSVYRVLTRVLASQAVAGDLVEP